MILRQRLDKNRTGSPLTDFALDVENIFEQVFGEVTATSNSNSDWVPRSNVIESDGAYSVELELPGIASEDVSVELKDGNLEISGEKKMADMPEGSKLLKSERRKGTFQRSFKFSTQLDADKISASFKNGILLVELPKSEQVLPRKIEVKIEG